jgi:O-antigen ligase
MHASQTERHSIAPGAGRPSGSALFGDLAAAGIIAVVITTSKAPEWTLAAAGVLTLAGGSYVGLASLGYAASLLGAAVSLLGLISRRELGGVFSRLVIPFFLLAFVAVRFLGESDWNSAFGVVKCLAVVILVADVVMRKRDFVLALGLSSLVFTVASLVVGEYNFNNTRLLGFTGNPNRLVFGVLVLLPFLLALLARTPSRTLRVVFFAGALGLSAYVIGQSGSSQGIIGLIVLVLLLLGMVLKRWSTIVAVIFWTLSGLLIVAAVSFGGALTFLPSDVSTLSGRVGLFDAAWSEFLQSPLFGTGSVGIDFGAAEARSTHSALLTFLLTAGIVAGVLWAVILWKLTVAGVRNLSMGNAVGLAPLLLLTEQTVQAVAFTPLAWIIVSLTLLTAPRAGRKISDD